MKTTMALAAAGLFIALSCCCDKGEKVESKIHHAGEQTLDMASALQRLKDKKIYFGHQSVGYNIVDGIRDVLADNPSIRMNVVESDSPTVFRGGVFAHSRNGKNMDPKSKIDAFVHSMENGIGVKADIAFFKFCYVDVLQHADANALFDYYTSAMSRLEKKYPHTIFVHVTVPLSVKPSGARGFVKKIIGRDHNIKRNEFNDLLRRKYPAARVYDLAAIESTYPDGRHECAMRGGRCIYALATLYTYDDGHLNETGRKIAAARLLAFLSSAAD